MRFPIPDNGLIEYSISVEKYSLRIAQSVAFFYKFLITINLTSVHTRSYSVIPYFDPRYLCSWCRRCFLCHRYLGYIGRAPSRISPLRDVSGVGSKLWDTSYSRSGLDSGECQSRFAIIRYAEDRGNALFDNDHPNLRGPEHTDCILPRYLGWLGPDFLEQTLCRDSLDHREIQRIPSIRSEGDQCELAKFSAPS
jgi:hypothetical protein